ncbi:hypothetical protein TNCV_1149731 [Trichonephila clavipes]|nr:hypothetical protein TNCV_1149731 [Trichonephila clavipes]
MAVDGSTTTVPAYSTRCYIKSTLAVCIGSMGCHISTNPQSFKTKLLTVVIISCGVSSDFIAFLIYQKAQSFHSHELQPPSCRWADVL